MVNFWVDLRREQQGDKFYSLSLWTWTRSFLFSSNLTSILSSHLATWYKGEKVSVDAMSIFLRRFHWRHCCRIVRSQMCAERGTRGKHACASRSCSFSHFSLCNAGRRLLTQAISQPKFHENWATKLGMKKKGKGKGGSRKHVRETKRQPHWKTRRPWGWG